MANTTTLRRRIGAIKKELAGLGDLRPGSLSQQYNVCGNPKCRCKADPPQKHGPYYQLAWSRKGRHTTAFVRQDEVETVQQEVENYRRLQALVQEWIDISQQLCELRHEARRRK